MSKLKDNRSNDNDRKSSNIIIISKSRISSAKNKGNFMTVQEGELRFTVKMNHEPLTKRTINQTILSMRKDLTKNSHSYMKLDSESRKLDLYLNKKRILCSPYKEKDSKELDSFFNITKEINKIKLKSILNAETTKSNKVIETTEVNIFNNDNKDKKNYYNNFQDNEFEIKNLDLISNNNKEINLNIKDFNKNENENKENNINIINNEYNDNETIDINLKDTNNVNPKNYFSQNYFNNDKKIKKILPIDKHKSEEINQKSSNNINEIDSKKDYKKEKNIQLSDKTMNDQVSKNILGSLMAHIGGENHENDIINIHNLMTENEDDKSSKNSIRSKDELISKSKSVKIDEEESVEVEEDEYDEKEKENNNKELISSWNIKSFIPSNANNEASHNNNNNNNENFKILINEFNNKNKSDFKNLSLYQNNSIVYKMCNICEHTYSMTKIFVAKCNEHFICKRCAKNYYEDIIEGGKNNEILCPFLKCREPIEFSDLKNIISQEHYNRLFRKNKNNFYFTKIKTNINKEDIEKYSKKNVIDINSNKNFFNYNSEKEGYCPFCYEGSIFLKTNTQYYKCLNCLSKICKYCFKEYDERHLDINYMGHCKVYYRLENDENKGKNNKFSQFLLELFFVCACFYLCFAGSFLLIRQMFFYLFNIRKGRNIIKYIFIYFFTIIIFIIIIPFIFLLYPYFPSIISIFDY